MGWWVLAVAAAPEPVEPVMAVTRAVPFTPAYHVLSVFGVWSLGGLFVAPIFIGAILAFTFLVDPSQAAVGGAVGRNDPCPCGSGLKYKRCCGAERAAATGGA